MTRRPGQETKEGSSFWTMSIGGSRKRPVADDQVEHEEFIPRLPGVNLLPQRVRDSIAIGRSRTVLLLLIVVLGAATLGLWWMQSGTIEEAEAELARTQELRTELVDQVAALAPAKQFYSEVTALEELVSTTLADQPRAREVLDRLRAAVETTGGRPPVSILSVAVTYTGVPAAGGPLSTCPNPDPFSERITIGCVSFSATANSRTQVSELLRTLEADPLFVGPYVTSTTAAGAEDEGAGSVTFTGSAGISTDGLENPLTDEEIEAIVNPVTPQESTGTDEAAEADAT